MGIPTKLHAITKKRVNDQYNRIRSELFDFWLMFPSKTGLEFEGTPHTVFWARVNGVNGQTAGRIRGLVVGQQISPIECNIAELKQHHPYRLLKEAIETVLMETADTCRKYELNPKLYIKEAELKLKKLIKEVYCDMTLIDQRLRGKGFPNRVKRVDCSYYRDGVEELLRYLKEHAEAAMLIAPRPTAQKKKGILRKLLKWLVGIIGAIIVSIIADILGHFGWIERIKTIVHNILTSK
jgi:hypothetical protein